MPKLILHIGHPKTGTTSLQRALCASREALLTHGIQYPVTPHFYNHLAIAPYFIGSGAAFDQLTRKLGCAETDTLAASKDAWGAVIEDIARHKSKTVVLSAEHFFMAGVGGRLPDFINGLHDVFSEITVVGYLRDPASYYLSGKQQRLKGLRRKSTKRHAGYFQVALEPYLSDARLCVNVHKFSRGELIGNDIVDDFVARYLPDVPRACLTVPHEDANASISAEAMAMIEDVWSGELVFGDASHHAKSERLVSYIRNTDIVVPGKSRPRYKPGVAAAIYDARTDLEWTERQFGLTFERPKADETPVSLDFDSAISTRDLCVVDEDRYAALAKQISNVIKREQSMLRHYDQFVHNMRRLPHRARTVMRSLMSKTE